MPKGKKVETFSKELQVITHNRKRSKKCTENVKKLKT